MAPALRGLGRAGSAGSHSRQGAELLHTGALSWLLGAGVCRALGSQGHGPRSWHGFPACWGGNSILSWEHTQASQEGLAKGSCQHLSLGLASTQNECHRAVAVYRERHERGQNHHLLSASPFLLPRRGLRSSLYWVLIVFP